MGIVHEYIAIVTYCILHMADTLLASCVSINIYKYSNILNIACLNAKNTC